MISTLMIIPVTASEAKQSAGLPCKEIASVAMLLRNDIRGLIKIVTASEAKQSNSLPQDQSAIDFLQDC